MIALVLTAEEVVIVNVLSSLVFEDFIDSLRVEVSSSFVETALDVGMVDVLSSFLVELRIEEAVGIVDVLSSFLVMEDLTDPVRVDVSMLLVKERVFVVAEKLPMLLDCEMLLAPVETGKAERETLLLIARAEADVLPMLLERETLLTVAGEMLARVEADEPLKLLERKVVLTVAVKMLVRIEAEETGVATLLRKTLLVMARPETDDVRLEALLETRDLLEVGRVEKMEEVLMLLVVTCDLTMLETRDALEVGRVETMDDAVVDFPVD